MSQKKLGIVEAFKSYGAPLKNSRSAVSSIAPDGALVISCSGDLLSYRQQGSDVQGHAFAVGGQQPWQ